MRTKHKKCNRQKISWSEKRRRTNSIYARRTILLLLLSSSAFVPFDGKNVHACHAHNTFGLLIDIGIFITINERSVRDCYYGREFQANLPNLDYVSLFASLFVCHSRAVSVYFFSNTHLHTPMEVEQCVCAARQLLYMYAYGSTYKFRRMRKFRCIFVVMVFVYFIGSAVHSSRAHSFFSSLRLPQFCMYVSNGCVVCVCVSKFLFSVHFVRSVFTFHSSILRRLCV